MDSSATVSLIVRLLARAAPWIMVRFFSIHKLDALLEIHPMPTGEAVNLYYPNRQATCWLHVINLTPFQVQLDRLEITIAADRLSTVVQKILPDTVPSLTKKSIFCQGNFSADPSAIALAVKSTKICLDIRGYVTCSARSFLFQRHFDDLRGFRISG
jgi:hypothetical protein